MSIKTVSLVFLRTNQPQESAACLFALNLAEVEQAQLSVCIGVPPLFVAMDAASSELLAWAEENNESRRRAAISAGEQIHAAATSRGIASSHEIRADAYDPIFKHVVEFARVSDLCIVETAGDNDDLQYDMVLDLIMNSGVPTIVVPKYWDGKGPLRTAIVAWDGSAPAVRAVRDARPLLEQSETVEIVSVHGEKVLGGRVAGGDIAKNISRHCKQVRVIDIPVRNGEVAAALRQHAKLIHAELIVMGAYGHSRFREFIAGGATRDMLKNIEIPTLFSH